MSEEHLYPLVKYQWYTTRVGYSKTVATAQCMGFDHDTAAMRFYDVAPWRTSAAIARQNIIEDANDPRIVIRAAKLFARYAADLDFI